MKRTFGARPVLGRSLRGLAVAFGLCLGLVSCGTKNTPPQELRKISLQEGASVDEYRSWARRQTAAAPEEEKSAATLETVALLREACAKNMAPACVALGQLIQDSSKSHFFSASASERAFSRACALDPDFCVYLARLHCEGEASASDLEEAETLYQKACRGDAPPPSECEAFLATCGALLEEGRQPAVPTGILECARGESCSAYSIALQRAPEQSAEELAEDSESLLVRGCKNLSARDCLVLGTRLMQVVESRGRGRQYLQEACSIQKDFCLRAAEVLSDVTPGDLPNLLSLLEPTCIYRRDAGCQKMEWLCSSGSRRACEYIKDIEYEEEGLASMERYCRAGDDIACDYFSLLAPLRGLKDGEQIAVLRGGCDSGSERACAALPVLISQSKKKFPSEWKRKTPKPIVDESKREKLMEGCLKSCSGCWKLVEEVDGPEVTEDVAAFSRALECTCKDLSSQRAIRSCARAAGVSPDHAPRKILKSLCEKSERDCNLLATDLYREGASDVTRVGLFLRACKAGNEYSCRSVIGFLVRHSPGSTLLSDGQIVDLKVLCEKDASKCLPYAVYLSQQPGEPRRYRRLVSAVKVLDAACKRDSRSCGLSADFAESVRLGPGLKTSGGDQVGLYARACKAHGIGSYACRALAEQHAGRVDSALCEMGEVERCR